MAKNVNDKIKQEQRIARNYYPVEYFVRFCLIEKFWLYPLAKTPITPNQITFLSLIFAICSFIALYFEKFILSGCFFMLYSLADHTDGMLARYKKSSSEFGKKLDIFVDIFAFNAVFIFYALFYPQAYLACIVILVVMNTHSFICSFYIVKNIRKITANGGAFQRFGLKKWFDDRGLLLGIDPSVLGISVSVGLAFGCFEFVCFFLTFYYAFDLFYRMYELHRNLRKL